MMELGATICKPVAPLCGSCPVAAACGAHRSWLEYIQTGGNPDIEEAPRVTNYPEKVGATGRAKQSGKGKNARGSATLQKWWCV